MEIGTTITGYIGVFSMGLLKLRVPSWDLHSKDCSILGLSWGPPKCPPKGASKEVS